MTKANSVLNCIVDKSIDRGFRPKNIRSILVFKTAVIWKQFSMVTRNCLQFLNPAVTLFLIFENFFWTTATISEEKKQ